MRDEGVNESFFSAEEACNKSIPGSVAFRALMTVLTGNHPETAADSANRLRQLAELVALQTLMTVLAGNHPETAEADTMNHHRQLPVLETLPALIGMRQGKSHPRIAGRRLLSELRV